MKINTLEMITLHIPFYTDYVTQHMQRALTHSEQIEIYRVELDTRRYRLWRKYGGRVRQLRSVIGQNPFAIMQDDSIGFGIQMSLFDAVGKSVGVPVYQLLGAKVRDRCPISWWDIDMPPEDWVKEAEESVKRGYTSIKLKARPWRDIFEQVEAVGKVVQKVTN